MEMASFDRHWQMPWYWRTFSIILFCLPGLLWGPIFFLLMHPMIAALFAPLVIDVPRSYVGWVRRRLWEPEQGNYYAFDGCQIASISMRPAKRAAISTTFWAPCVMWDAKHSCAVRSCALPCRPVRKARWLSG
jgi:hypothetical protein